MKKKEDEKEGGMKSHHLVPKQECYWLKMSGKRQEEADTEEGGRRRREETFFDATLHEKYYHHLHQWFILWKLSSYSSQTNLKTDMRLKTWTEANIWSNEWEDNKKRRRISRQWNRNCVKEKIISRSLKEKSFLTRSSSWSRSSSSENLSWCEQREDHHWTIIWAKKINNCPFFSNQLLLSSHFLLILLVEVKFVSRLDSCVEDKDIR